MKRKDDQTLLGLGLALIIIFACVLAILLLFGGLFYLDNKFDNQITGNSVNLSNKPKCEIVNVQKQVLEPVEKYKTYQYADYGYFIEYYGVFNNYEKVRYKLQNKDTEAGEFQIKYKLTFADGGIEEGYGVKQIILPNYYYYWDSAEYKNRHISTVKIEILVPKKTWVENEWVTKTVPERRCY